MNITMIILICSILLIDFAKLENKNKKTVYLYILISMLILVVGIIDKYDFFTTSLFEVWIDKVKPINK